MSRPKHEQEDIVKDIRHNVGHFVENPYLRLGDADSAHGVIFGELDSLGEVAVKPHSKPPRPRAEFRNLERAAARGVDAVVPLQVADGQIAHYLFTQRRPGLSHLGQVNWGVGIAAPELRSVVAPTLNLGASTIADMHNVGITNLDSQAKNIVFDTDGNHVLADGERISFDEPYGTRTIHANHDVQVLGYSVLHRGLLADRSPTYRAGFLTDEIAEPYLGRVDGELFPDPLEVRREDIKDKWIGFIQKRPGIH